jgi:hypothetical protein
MPAVRFLLPSTATRVRTPAATRLDQILNFAPRRRLSVNILNRILNFGPRRRLSVNILNRILNFAPAVAPVRGRRNRRRRLQSSARAAPSTAGLGGAGRPA